MSAQFGECRTGRWRGAICSYDGIGCNVDHMAIARRALIDAMDEDYVGGATGLDALVQAHNANVEKLRVVADCVALLLKDLSLE